MVEQSQLNGTPCINIFDIKNKIKIKTGNGAWCSDFSGCACKNRFARALSWNGRCQYKQWTLDVSDRTRYNDFLDKKRCWLYMINEILAEFHIYLSAGGRQWTIL